MLMASERANRMVLVLMLAMNLVMASDAGNDESDDGGEQDDGARGRGKPCHGFWALDPVFDKSRKP